MLSGYTDRSLLNTELLVMHFELLLLVLICIPNLFFPVCFVTSRTSAADNLFCIQIIVFTAAYLCVNILQQII